MKFIKDKFLLLGLFSWITATSFYFLFNSIGFALSPIAEDGLISILTMYIPVLFLKVFSLKYLTRKRERVDWIELYSEEDFHNYPMTGFLSELERC